MSSEEAQDKAANEAVLMGDTREDLLKAIKRCLKWQELPEKTQRSLVNEIEHVAKQAIRRIEGITIARERPFTEIKISGWVVDNGKGIIQVKATAPLSRETVLHLTEHAAGIIVFGDADLYMDEREPSEIFPDQPDLMAHVEPEKTQEEQNVELLRAGILPLDVSEDDVPAEDQDEPAPPTVPEDDAGEVAPDPEVEAPAEPQLPRGRSRRKSAPPPPTA